MKKSCAVVYGLVMLLLGMLIGGGVAFGYVNRITVGKVNYDVNFEEKSGYITVYKPHKVSNVRVAPGDYRISFDVVSN